MTLITTTLTILIMIPIVPLFAYVVGLLVPATHIVSKSLPFKISRKRLWNILIDVNKYPQWQSKVEKVTIDDSSNDETVFIEHSTKKRHTIMIHHERIQYQCLLRILEERPVSSFPPKIPTFSGSWTFEITQEKEDDQVILKITEQGVIKKPLVRVTHLLLSGFYSRIDRFMKDLSKKVDNDNQQLIVDSIIVQELPVNSTNENELVQQDTEEKLIIKQSTPDQSTPDQSVAEVSAVVEPLEPENLQEFYSTVLTTKENDTSIATDQSQLLETNHTLMTESKITDKEWDLMSEIYERNSN